MPKPHKTKTPDAPAHLSTPAHLSAPAQHVAPMPRAGELVYASLSQLKIHPANIRRCYPADDVREMADSIKGYPGLVHPLQIVPDGEPGAFYVVDGNLRLTAARTLGADCPPLKAEIISQSRAEQLLTMIVANKHYDVDVISEALHYRRLRQEEGLSYLDIAERTGTYYQRVINCLELLKLDEPIQQLIAADKLPKDRRVVKALLSVNDPQARVKLASKLAAGRARITTVEKACARLVEQLAAPVELAASPMVSHALRKAKRPAPKKDAKIPPASLREAARAMCAVCDIKATQLASVPEPAWALVAHHADDVCGNCNLRGLGVCAQCPGVELLRAVVNGVPVAEAAR